jgi:spore photoproduct lyase
MLALPAKTVYIAPDVRRNPACRARLERMLPHVRCTDIRDLDEAALQAVFDLGKRRHGKDDFGDDAVVVFATYDERRAGWYCHWRDEAGAHGGACQPALELNLVDGCVFRCAYCGFGRSIIFYLDVERLIAGLDAVFARYPAQRLYKYSNMTDLPPFEPEADLVPPMVRRFAREPERYLMLFTKSHNVDFLLDLEHGGRTIVSWSLTCDTASRLVDKRTATLAERVDAMAKVQAAGYPVRARLSPIVPVANWRAEYEQLFRLLLGRVRPDVVTLELLGWMTVDDLLALFDRSLLDAGALAAAEAARGELAGVHWGPFTQATHEEVYRFCLETVQRIAPGTPVSLCHGTPASWAALGPAMRMTPDDYLCNCGPLTTPGAALYDRWNAGRKD